MAYVFRLLAFPISPYLQRGINKIERQKASKTIEKLLEDLVKIVVASENNQTASKQSSGRPDVTSSPETLPIQPVAPESIENDIEVITIDSSEDEAPEVPKDVEMVVEYLVNEVVGQTPSEPGSSKILEALTPSGSLNSLVNSFGFAPPQDLDLDFSSSGPVNSSQNSFGFTPPQDLDLDFSPPVVEEASSLPPRQTSSDSNDPNEASSEAVEPARPVMTPEPIQDQEIPKIQAPETAQMVMPPRPRALSFSLSEDSSDDEVSSKKKKSLKIRRRALTSSKSSSAHPQDSDSDDSSDDQGVKKLTSSGSAPPQDSDSVDDSSDDKITSPPPKRRRPRFVDSSDSDDYIVSVQKSGCPANQMAAPAALPVSPMPVLTPEPMDDVEITISQTINLSILLNQDTPASTPIPSPGSAHFSGSAHFPPSMKKSRASNIYEHIVSMCEYMKTDLHPVQIENLQQDLKSRNRLYERYVEEGRLQPTDPNNKSRQEHLPIYVFLMAPKTKNSYLDAFKNDKIPINATFHESIFKASMKNDENTVELLLIYFLSGKMKAKSLEIHARAIAEGKEFRVEEDVIGVIKVESLDKVPDGSCFACFEKMPPISELQSKSLNCVVMNPSDPDQISILQQPGVKVSVNLEGLSIGKPQNPACKCFGPKVLVPTVIPKIFDNLASLFHRILYNKKGHTNDNIYVVEGFW